jgi:hypothetical protein
VASATPASVPSSAEDLAVTQAPIDNYHVPQWLGAKARRRFHVMAKPAGT